MTTYLILLLAPLLNQCLRLNQNIECLNVE
jgi:hypothetical protein